MLVLSRKLNESIQIGDQITLRVVQIRGNRVRLGIEAPSDVRIVRSELNDIAEVELTASSAAPEQDSESMVIVPPFAAEAVSDVMPPELLTADADHWQTQVRSRPTARPRRLRMWMPETPEAMPLVATAK